MDADPQGLIGVVLAYPAGSEPHELHDQPPPWEQISDGTRSLVDIAATICAQLSQSVRFAAVF